ncbi:MAG: hypothetical protein JW931_02975 [Methanomicrobiaceae archaeon]|nr:hypothetical protein [Methanomicrobiaceae archaeon]
MEDTIGLLMLGIVTLCFGFLSGFQMAHIHYNKRLVRLVKRCIHSGTIAPILVELENNHSKNLK